MNDVDAFCAGVVSGWLALPRHLHVTLTFEAGDGVILFRLEEIYFPDPTHTRRRAAEKTEQTRDIELYKRDPRASGRDLFTALLEALEEA